MQLREEISGSTLSTWDTVRMWFQWTGEYIKSLQESITSTIRRGPSIKEGDVVLIQSDKRNRGRWNLGIVVKLIKGRDGVVRGARLWARRAIQ